MSRNARPRAQAFTLVELLVVIGIILVLISMLIPVLAATWERARRTQCASNLHQIGIALHNYASTDKRGMYPRTVYEPDYPGVYAFEGPTTGNNVTSALYLLVRQRLATADLFLCPSAGRKPTTFISSSPVSLREDFGWESPYSNTLQYSYANPYPGTHEQEANYRPIPSVLAPDFALAADRNDLWAWTGQHAPNSPNHDWKGQNVLYNDGHVAWSDTVLCGHNGDNIFRRDPPAGSTPGWGLTPSHRNDSILVPADMHWGRD